MSSPAHLSKDLLDKDILREPNRKGFGIGLKKAGQVDENVWALCADLTESTQMHLFAEEFPQRYVEIGVAEQNLATVASGIAAMGKVPFISSYAAFSPGRNWEQIRTTIALNDQPVKIIGSHAGVSVGPDGATHQMLEDIAIMRAMPNMMVIAPADSVEAEKATLAIAKDPRPTYMRLARAPVPVFTTDKTPFSLDKAQVMSVGRDLTIISTGTMTYHALIAAEKLYNDGIDAEVIHVPVIKPLDGMTILHSAEKTGAVITIEEHQITGGLGGAVAEFLSENHTVPIRRMGMMDRFGESGDPDELIEKFGLTHKNIEHMAHSMLHELGRE
jgi:transketolase